MIDAFLAPQMVPYTLALALLIGLFCLELIFALLGATLLGAGGDVDVDVPDFSAEPFDIGDLDIDLAALDGLDADLGEFELPAFEADGPDVPDAAGGALAWLGVGKAPFVLWVAALLMGFGLGGFLLVNLVQSGLGWTLPIWISLPPSVLAGGWFASRFAAVFARLLPKTESSALPRSRLARRKGVISQGIARRGHPAEVRITDYYGNLHYIRAEPLQDTATLAQGTEVLVLRHRPTAGFRLIDLSG